MNNRIQNILPRMLSFSKVTLQNQHGHLISVSKEAIGGVGIYDITGRFFSWVTLEVDGYFIRK